MKEIWIITYAVSVGGGHGEGSLAEAAVWISAGAFTSKDAAQRYIDTHEWPYGASLRPLAMCLSLTEKKV